MKRAASSIIAIVAGFAINAYAQTATVYKGSEPGKAGVALTLDMNATIVAIDKATRDITLRGPNGGEVVVTASSAVKNFDQMKAGDLVYVKYVEALSLELKPAFATRPGQGGDLAVARQDQKIAAGAMPGDQPAGVVGRRVTVAADVVALDPATQIVTLKGPERTVDVKVADADQFKRIKMGDQVWATYTQALASVVEPKK